MMAVLVAYDITDNRKRRNLYKTLAAYGLPLQKSVFVCELNRTQRMALRKDLMDLPLESDDRIHCFDINVKQTQFLSPSPLSELSWIEE